MQFVCGPLSVTLYSPEVDAISVKLDQILKVYAPAVFGLTAKLDALQASFDSFKKEYETNMDAMGEALKTLTDDVTQQTTVTGGVITLIQGLAAQIAANAGDPAAVTALAGQIKTNTEALAAAIAANTPSASATTA